MTSSGPPKLPHCIRSCLTQRERRKRSLRPLSSKAFQYYGVVIQTRELCSVLVRLCRDDFSAKNLASRMSAVVGRHHPAAGMLGALAQGAVATFRLLASATAPPLSFRGSGRSGSALGETTMREELWRVKPE